MSAGGRPSSDARKAASIGGMAALTAAGGYALTYVPNVEIMTLMAFAGGWLTGALGGAAVGVLGMVIYTFINPYGAAVPLVAAAQILSLGLVGVCGGLWSRRGGVGPRNPSALRLGALGVGLTLVYDFATNVAIGISFGRLLPTLVAGIPFALIHIGSNALVLAIAGPYLIRGLASAGLCPQGRISA